MPTGKNAWKPGNLVMPAPAALVSCQAPGEAPNLLAVAWCGNVNSTPPMLSVSLRPSRLSHGVIAQTGEFVLNIPSRRLARQVDLCGVISGRDGDKFAAAGLTPLPIGGVSCPGVAECPVNLPCRVTQRIPLGSHDLFLARIGEVMVDADLLDRGGRFRLEAADLLCYAHSFYFALGQRLGRFGWSVRKKPAKRLSREKRARKG
ncbi:MAG: flavin reductase family protein [Planctomycetota bacterium]|nr:flavin reductase family protein [Planctomycetota bacterium]